MTKDEIKKFPQCTYYCPDCKYFKDGYCAQPALITDQEREIERFQNEYDKAFERLKAQQREIDDLKAENKQLKTECALLDDELRIARQETIDVLNELKERIPLAMSKQYVCAQIDEMIKEVQNDRSNQARAKEV